MIKTSIITVSDKASCGEREDKSAGAIKEFLTKAKGFELASYEIVPDELIKIVEALKKASDEVASDLVLTTGGTGWAHRDVTPEATKSAIEKEAPGIAELMRGKTVDITPKSYLSRAVCGIRGKSLIVNLPGSPKAVLECLEAIMPILPHGIEVLKGEISECAR